MREPVRSLGPSTSRGCARTRGRGRGSPRPRGTASLRFSPARRRDDQPADLWCAEVRSGGCGWYAYTGGRRQAVCRSSREPLPTVGEAASGPRRRARASRMHEVCRGMVRRACGRHASSAAPDHRVGAQARGETSHLNAEERIGPGGLEPPFPDPKSGVLPLDEGPASLQRPNLAHASTARHPHPVLS